MGWLCNPCQEWKWSELTASDVYTSLWIIALMPSACWPPLLLLATGNVPGNQSVLQIKLILTALLIYTNTHKDTQTHIFNRNDSIIHLTPSLWWYPSWPEPIETGAEQARNRLSLALQYSCVELNMGWLFNFTGETQGNTHVQCHTSQTALK